MLTPQKPRVKERKSLRGLLHSLATADTVSGLPPLLVPGQPQAPPPPWMNPRTGAGPQAPGPGGGRASSHTLCLCSSGERARRLRGEDGEP